MSIEFFLAVTFGGEPEIIRGFETTEAARAHLAGIIRSDWKTEDMPEDDDGLVSQAGEDIDNFTWMITKNVRRFDDPIASGIQ